MSLSDSYTIKNGAIPAYFEAILSAEAPDRFSIKFLENLEFTSSNDRLIIGVLKDLGFLNADGVPQDRYYQYLDRSQSTKVLAEGIRQAYSDLFAVNKEAYKLDVEGAINKLRTLYRGEKKDTVIKYIAKTFVALCEIADFSKTRTTTPVNPIKKSNQAEEAENRAKPLETDTKPQKNIQKIQPGYQPARGLGSLQYHINIVLPDTRDQSVYDAIFKSLRDHLE